MKRISNLLTPFLLVLLCGNVGASTAFPAVGSHIENSHDISGVRRGPCTPDDCEMLTKDGSRWTLFGHTITAQRYLRSEAGRRLPFGLFHVSGETKSLRLLRARTGVTFTKAGQHEYAGLVKLKDGTDATLYVKFTRRGTVSEIGLTLGETGD